MRHLDGNEYGPFTDLEVSAYIAESRIVRSSELKHVEHTNGAWLNVEAIPTIASKLPASPPPMHVQPPPIACEPPAFETKTYSRPPNQSRTKRSRTIVLTSIVSGFATASALAFVGVALSQYWPVFGGTLERGMAQPWSPARVGLIPIHVFVFALVGVVAGSLLGAGWVVAFTESKGK